MGEAICAASKTREAPATLTLCSRLCCLPQSSEVSVTVGFQPPRHLIAYPPPPSLKRDVCVSSPAEELFGLGPEQLGRLEDKEKPGAKVSIRTVWGVLPDT